MSLSLRWEAWLEIADKDNICVWVLSYDDILILKCGQHRSQCVQGDSQCFGDQVTLDKIHCCKQPPSEVDFAFDTASALGRQVNGCSSRTGQTLATRRQMTAQF